MSTDESALRAAMREWLDAADALDAAGTDDYAETLRLAEEASIARLQLHSRLVELGWTPPASGAPRSSDPAREHRG